MPTLNYPLIFILSLVGLAIAFTGVYGITTMQTEPYVWLVVFIAFAFIIARFAKGNYFLHGFLVSVLCGCWIGLIHALYIHQYLRSNPRLKPLYDEMPHIGNPKITIALSGPMAGVVFGIVAGLFAFIAARILNRKAAAAK